MKIDMKFDGTLISAKESEYKSQNGSMQKSYSLAVEHQDDAGNISCEKSVYDAVRNGVFPKYASCVISAVYDTNYKNLRIYDLRVKEKAK